MYWTDGLPAIEEALRLAAEGTTATIALRGLRDLGERQSWHGLAEVRATELTRRSMAHATSLGKTVAASRLCQRWPEQTFRFSISTAGDILTVAATAGRRSRPGSPAGTWRSHPGNAVAADPDEFYRMLDELAELRGGIRPLREFTSGSCPRQGVYFFFEDGEVRRNGCGRIVRVGTHALTATGMATLWGRLRHHLGRRGGRTPGSGSHRASVFRRHVGTALILRDHLPEELLKSWLDRHGPHEGWESQEIEIEMAVSRHIGGMPVLLLGVPDWADRGYVERNSIALTSRLAAGLDLPSHGWLGHYAVRNEIPQSGLWNVEHVTARCDPGFLATLERLVQNSA